MIEPIPDDCLPPPHVIDELLRGPTLDEHGRIIGGVWDGLTAEDVLRDRDEYRRMYGD